jgi:hypothetical protein
MFIKFQFTEKVDTLRSLLYKRAPNEPQERESSADGDRHGTQQGSLIPLPSSRYGRHAKPSPKLLESNEITDLKKQVDSRVARNDVNKMKRTVCVCVIFHLLYLSV